MVAIAALLVGTAAAQPQAPARTARIGFLQNGTLASGGHFAEAFTRGMSELGYAAGRNLSLDVRYADGQFERLPGLARDIVATRPDVIVAPSALAAGELRKTGTTIPIVFALAPDPVGDGFAASLARPGGTMTGLTSQSPELGAKRVQLLREILPRMARVALLFNTAFPGVAIEAPETERAAVTAGLQTLRLEPKQPGDFEAAFAQAAKWRADALIVIENPMFFTHREKIVALARKGALPAIYRSREYVDAGGLISYGADYVDLVRRSAGHVDKILRGARPGDLPVEQPVKFELVVNAKTAGSLGLKLPQPLLLRSDQVIE